MIDSARIIDANANRAREGLRVLEEIARFHLDDALLSGALKQTRHDLMDEVEKLPISVRDRMIARDTPEDVGTGISTAREQERNSVDALAGSNSARVSEALRVLEETAKLAGASGAGFERLRYRLYEIERALRLRLQTRAPQWRLCVLVSEGLCRRAWQEVVEGSLAGGADCVQLREKQMAGGALLARARELVALVQRRAVVIINDRPDVALLAGADGVHLGRHDLPVSEVRKLARGRLIIGCSASSVEMARAAAAGGADYLGLGAMFATHTKNSPDVVGLGLIREVLRDPEISSWPHVAIGGITPHNAAEVYSAGARGVAVSSCVCSDPDPERICRAILAYRSDEAGELGHSPKSGRGGAAARADARPGLSDGETGT
ncbi:MAG: thiamine phosphate synthase [Phycisphaerales bacterium]|nr:thiamine phosphate synthase [Phycisphaerales bacterium]